MDTVIRPLDSALGMEDEKNPDVQVIPRDQFHERDCADFGGSIIIPDAPSTTVSPDVGDT